jgi:hypothetical protein
MTSNPIRATIIEHDECEAEGFVVKAYSPVLAMCRQLIGVGYDPCRPLLAYRGGVLALRVRTIGQGAKLTVGENRTGCPTFRRHQDAQKVVSEPCPCEKRLAA